MANQAAELLEEGNPGLAALVDRKGPHCDDDGEYEWETMGTWAEDTLGIDIFDMKDEHIPQWRKTPQYHEFRYASPRQLAQR